MTRFRTIAIVIVCLGVLAGILGAVLIPAGPAAPAARPFGAPSQPLRTAPARTRERGPTTPSSVYLRAHPGTVTIEARHPDPAGGPDWVVRVFEADRMIQPAIRRPGTDGVISVGLCAQLGRDLRGRFGWIDGTNTFRSVSTAALTGSPSLCGSRKLDTRKLPELRATTLVDRPRSLNPTLRGTIVWGLIGRRTDGATLTAAGRTGPVRTSGAHRSFVRIVGPSARVVGATLKVRYPGGATRTRVDGVGGAIPGRGQTRKPGFIAGSSRVIARTFDPGGGPSWGARAARTPSGGWCLGPAGHLVGDRIGEIEEPLGTLVELPETSFPNGCGPQAQPGPAVPVQFVTSGGSYADVPQLDPGRGALRLERGRSFIWGRAADNVDLITIATARDVRTVEPSGPANAFIVVYDGIGFGGGDITLTVHFKGGRQQTLTSLAMY